MLKSAFGKQKLITLPGSREYIESDEKTIGQKRCPSCSRHISELELKENHRLCPECQYHFPMSAWERIELMADAESFEEFDSELRSINILDFPGYDEKLARAMEQTGLNEALVTGHCTMGGYPVILGVMDSRFMMASMGSVVGEKVCRAVEKAVDLQIPLILCAASGGARMQEGMLALMQMAKTSAALNRFHQEGLLYISLLTNPTTGGVSASFASLADIVLAEPGALIGFAGPRVIKQTISEILPADFQKAEFLLKHGMVDKIVERPLLKDTMEYLLKLHLGGKHG